MSIRIEAGRIFEEIQKEFSDAYPYLKIEYVTSINSSGGKSLKKLCLCKKNCSKELCNGHTAIIVNDNTTVADLVNQFQEIFDLRVKVLRKANNLWLPVSLTDSWTVERQNSAGKQFNAS